MSSIDSRADFAALLDELQIPDALQEWIKNEGFETISDLTFAFIHSAEGDAFISKVPLEVWSTLNVAQSDVNTCVPAGRLRRLLAQGRAMVLKSQSALDGPAGPLAASALASPSWQEHAPPRLNPEAVAAMSATFSKNFPGELLTSETTPSIRLLSIIHHQLRPGQALRYVPWQLRISQKQYQDMMEAKTHKAVRSEAQLLGILWDDTPELPLDQMRLSAEWLLKVQQVFRNAFVMCGAAHLHTFKKFDQKVFDLTMKKFSPESNLRSVTLPELLEADKCIWAEIISLVAQQWSLDDALHELTSVRADLYGLLQPRPKHLGTGSTPKGPSKQVVKQTLKKPAGDAKASSQGTPRNLCSFIVQNNERHSLCQRFQSGRCTSKACKYKHLCAVKMEGGKPCGKGHSAAEHPHAAWLGADDFVLGGHSPARCAPSRNDLRASIPFPIEAPPGLFSTISEGRFFVELFATVNSPLARAAAALRVDAIFLANEDLAFLLNDLDYERLLHLAWGRWIAMLWFSFPGAVSRASSMSTMQQNAEIHARLQAILHAAQSQGAFMGIDATLADFHRSEHAPYAELLRSWNACCCQVAACSWGLSVKHTWRLCSNVADFSQLSSTCSCATHAGQKPQRASAPTNLPFPPKLATAVLQILAKRCTASGLQVQTPQLPLTHAGDPLAPLPVCDGAGLTSTADWTFSHAVDIFASLRHRLWHLAQERAVDTLIFHHLQQRKPSVPLSHQDLAPFCQLMDHWLRENGCSPSWDIAPGQSFRLHILECLAKLTSDPDLALLPSLHAGVPTGVLAPLQRSGLWPLKKPSVDEVDEPLLVHCTNWQAADEDPALTQSLIDAEISNGWVQELAGGLDEARSRWSHIALGKLNVVKVPDKAPRLVLDSSSCAVNHNCQLPESMMLPSVDDVRRSLASSRNIGEFAGLSLDIHAAHKQVRLHPSQQGLVLFQFNQRTYHYTVAHFGARFSAWWWQRLGGQILRLLHHFLHSPHRGWIYVDDLLLMLHRRCFLEQVTLVVVFLLLLNTPISWKKAQLGDRITWIGWEINFQFDIVQLTESKVAKLVGVIEDLLQHKQAKVKTLQTLIGLLIWFTSVARYLRPHLAELYRCLHSPPASLYSVAPQFWQEFRSLLDASATVVRTSPALCLPLGGRVVEYSHIPIRGKEDIPPMPWKSNLQWVRVQDLGASTITLTKAAISQMRWFLSLASSSRRIFSLHLPQALAVKAAADAFAHDNAFGIGGWIITSSQIVWFSEQYTMEDLRNHLPDLTKDAQKYICAFEVLAQLALVVVAARKLNLQNLSVTLPTASDNTAAEAGINKLLTTRWPASVFLQILGDFAFQQQMHLAVSHTPGHRNDWADDLSRDRISRWLKYPRCRVSLSDFFQIGRFISLHPAEGWSQDWRLLSKRFLFRFALHFFVFSKVQQL